MATNPASTGARLTAPARGEWMGRRRLARNYSWSPMKKSRGANVTPRMPCMLNATRKLMGCPSGPKEAGNLVHQGFRVEQPGQLAQQGEVLVAVGIPVDLLAEYRKAIIVDVAALAQVTKPVITMGA